MLEDGAISSCVDAGGSWLSNILSAKSGVSLLGPIGVESRGTSIFRSFTESEGASVLVSPAVLFFAASEIRSSTELDGPAPLLSAASSAKMSMKELVRIVK